MHASSAATNQGHDMAAASSSSKEMSSVSAPAHSDQAVFVYPDVFAKTAPAVRRKEFAQEQKGRDEVGKYLNARTIAAHVEERENEEGVTQKILVSPRGTPISDRVAESNGHAFYIGHSAIWPEGRVLQFADQNRDQLVYGPGDTHETLANSFSNARSLTLAACKYGSGGGQDVAALQQKIAEKRKEDGFPVESGPSVFAPIPKFVRQTVPGPAVNVPRGRLAEQGPTVMTGRNTQQLQQFVGNALHWRQMAPAGGVLQLPEIKDKR
jgi:hypothetical protein